MYRVANGFVPADKGVSCDAPRRTNEIGRIKRDEVRAAAASWRARRRRCPGRRSVKCDDDGQAFGATFAARHSSRVIAYSTPPRSEPATSPSRHHGTSVCSASRHQRSWGRPGRDRRPIRRRPLHRLSRRGTQQEGPGQRHTAAVKLPAPPGVQKPIISAGNRNPNAIRRRTSFLDRRKGASPYAEQGATTRANCRPG
jgi:hypothetical protein